MVCRGACPADDKSIAQTAGAVGKTAKVQKSLKGFLKKISTQARVREDVREKKSAGSRRERNRQGEALGRSARETAEEKRWDEARKKPPRESVGAKREKPPEGSAGTKHVRNRQRESAGAELRRSESQSADRQAPRPESERQTAERRSKSRSKREMRCGKWDARKEQREG